MSRYSFSGRRNSTALLVAALLQAATFLCPAASYFLHPLLGNDAGPGTSEQAPWKTLARTQAVALQAGDQVLLAAGQKFSGQLAFMGLVGRSNQPIVISSYRPTNAGGDSRAMIDARGHAAGLQLRNCCYVHISDLTISANGGGNPRSKGVGSDMRCGILIAADTAGNYGGITISNVTVQDVFYENPGFVRSAKEANTANGTEHYGWGIRFLVTSDRAILRDLTVTDCQIRDVEHTGLKLTGPSDTLQNVSVERLRITDSGGPGVQMSGVRGGHFTGLEVNRSGSTNDTRNWKRGSGLWTWGSSDVVIERSRFLNANGPGDSAGVHIDYHCRNVIVQYNLSANNAGGFCEILGNNYNCSYRYNVSINDGYRVKGKDGAFQEGKTFWLSGYQGKKFHSGPYNTYFYNNTIYVSAAIVAKMSVAPTARGVLIANNIFCIQGRSKSVKGDQERADDADLLRPSKDIVFENNLYLNAANWPADQLIQDRAPILGDPQFQNAGGVNLADYVPRNAKLIQGRGITIPKIPHDEAGLKPGLAVAVDILGHPIRSRPDMGAIEIP